MTIYRGNGTPGAGEELDYYTKVETDAKFATSTDLDSYYTKTEVDANTYTQAQVDANTYTKTQADAQFAPIARPRHNLLVNGSFLVWQRETTEAVPAMTDTYLADMWQTLNSTTGAYTLSRASIGAGGPDVNTTYSYSLDVSTSDPATAAAHRCYVENIIEGVDCGELNLGAAGARTVTLSFWTAHTKTGIHCAFLMNSARTRTYITEYTQAVSGAWQHNTVTIDLDTAGTWLETEASAGLRVGFVVAAGSNHHGSADTWLGTSDISTSNQVNNLDSASNFFYLAGVKLEMGTDATDFESRPFQEELALCQRYFCKTSNYDTHFGDIDDTGVIAGNGIGAASRPIVNWAFPVPMCKVPTLTAWNADNGTTGQCHNTTTGSDYTVTFYKTGARASAMYGVGTPALGNILWFHAIAEASL